MVETKKVGAPLVKALHKSREEREINDELLPGFGIRSGPKGVSYYVRYRIRGERRQRRRVLGSYPKMKLEAARNEAREILSIAGKGRDPDGPAGADPISLEELTKRWLDAAKIEDSTLRRYRSALGHHLWGKALAERQASAIHRREIASFVGEVAKESPVAANRLLSNLRTAFAWGIGQGLLEMNPADYIPFPTEEKPRRRVLSPAELEKIWVECWLRKKAPVQEALRVMILTLQRRSAVALMEIGELETIEEELWWRRPPTKTKSGREHFVPIAPFTAAILRRQIGRRKHGPVFRSKKTQGPIDPQSITRWAARSRKRVKVAAWTPHDLRRTGTTILGQKGVSIKIRRMILDHSGEGVTETVYDLWSYHPEIRSALQTWESWVLEAVGQEALDSVPSSVGKDSR